MTPNESMQLLEQILSRHGVDPRSVDPAAVWEAFKDWACQPTNSDKDSLVVNIGWFADNACSCIEFRRVFHDIRKEEDFDLLLGFYSSRADAPRLTPVEEHSEDAVDLRQFFRRVETLPGFELALRYPYWEFEYGRV